MADNLALTVLLASANVGRIHEAEFQQFEGVMAAVRVSSVEVQTPVDPEAVHVSLIAPAGAETVIWVRPSKSIFSEIGSATGVGRLASWATVPVSRIDLGLDEPATAKPTRARYTAGVGDDPSVVDAIALSLPSGFVSANRIPSAKPIDRCFMVISVCDKSRLERRLRSVLIQHAGALGEYTDGHNVRDNDRISRGPFLRLSIRITPHGPV